MPIHEFLCKSCGHQFEELLLTQNAKVICPECDSKNVSKQFSSFGVGSGQTLPCEGGRCDVPTPQPCCGTGECPGCEQM